MSQENSQLWQDWAIALLLFLAALAVRVVGLQTLPPGLYNDEAANGLDVLEILQGHHAIFFERNNGREPFFLYVQAVIVSLAGATPYALRLAAAIIGALSIPATYWMVRESFRHSNLPARPLATYSALWMAFAYWHISLSRVGFRAICLPLFAAVAMAFFWRAWRQLQEETRFPWRDLILCGAVLGGSLYTYTAARILPALIGVIVLAALLRVIQSRPKRTRLLAASAMIGLAAALVFAPLAGYFIRHPDSFFGRSASVSIFNPYFAGDDPWAALGRSLLDTALMFIATPDPNLRHNPAGRPVFEPLLAIWLAAGLALAALRGRKPPYFTLVVWCGLFAIPAVLTAEGTPHSLRAVGLMPAVFILPVIAMCMAGRRLFARRPRWAALFPLPFVLYSAVIGTSDYFLAWRDPTRFDGAFQTRYAQMAADMSRFGDADAVWLLPLSPNYHVHDATFYTVDFFYRGVAGYGAVPVDEAAAPARLATAAAGKRTVYLINSHKMSSFPDSAYVMGDPKHLLPFLLQRHARWVESHGEEEIGIPFDMYELPEHSDFSVYNRFQERQVNFADQVELIGVDYGSIYADQNAATNPGLALPPGTEWPAGEPLWVVLRWQALAPIAADLKVSLRLQDAAGHVIGQVDDLLVGDGYPVRRVWEAGETTGSYHILPSLPAVAPGTYDLAVRVYEDQTRRNFPVYAINGAGAKPEAVIGSVALTRSTHAPEVAPSVALDDVRLAPELELLGYDLPVQEVSSGDTLPLTLYWQAHAVPQSDYQVRVSLAAADGTPRVEQTRRPGNGVYATTRWAAGEVLRDWHDLAIPVTLENGIYRLAVTLLDHEQVLGAHDLGTVTVAGRPHRFDPPEIVYPTAATFDPYLRLTGVTPLTPLAIQPGETLTLDLIWQVQSVPASPLVRFVHLIAEDGQPLAQQDTAPCAGECPVSSWMEREYLVDRTDLALPPDLAPGTYRVIVGWYAPDTLQRLAAFGPDRAPLGDAVQLPLTVTVQEGE
ncbi:MAG: phospholipid carrier-dependent glycosyltransferase [Caldilineaceae bacterium]|nr:phospholipid carrier-dependent glycosyltransferase [Caldilineaceae bacterium]